MLRHLLPMIYAEREKLCQWVREAQAGRWDEDFIRAIRLIVRGVGGDEDDEQSALLDVLKSVHRIDPDKEVFAYLTCVAISKVRMRHRHEEAYDGMIKHFAWLNGWVPRWATGKRGSFRFKKCER